MSVKIDFHCHTNASKDGSISDKNIEYVIKNKILDLIVISDHDTIKSATRLKKKFGENIIVGEEISTKDGEIIGLYLKKAVKPGLSAEETIKEIRRQKGLVYVPHPFEKTRKGLNLATLDNIRDEIDIIEGVNGRAMSIRARKSAIKWASANNKLVAASSDSHGFRGWSRVYTELENFPTSATLLKEMENARLVGSSNGVISYIYPAINRFRNKRAAKARRKAIDKK